MPANPTKPFLVMFSEIKPHLSMIIIFAGQSNIICDVNYIILSHSTNKFYVLWFHKSSIIWIDFSSLDANYVGLLVYFVDSLQGERLWATRPVHDVIGSLLDLLLESYSMVSAYDKLLSEFTESAQLKVMVNRDIEYGLILLLKWFFLGTVTCPKSLLCPSTAFSLRVQYFTVANCNECWIFL